MTGERNTFSCLFPTAADPRHPPPCGCAPRTERPADVQLPPNNWPTSAVWAASDCFVAARYAPSGNPTAPPPPSTLMYPRPLWPFPAFLTPQPPSAGSSRHSKVTAECERRRNRGEGDVQTITKHFPNWNVLLLKEFFQKFPIRNSFTRDELSEDGLCGVHANHRVRFIKI